MNQVFGFRILQMYNNIWRTTWPSSWTTTNIPNVSARILPIFFIVMGHGHSPSPPTTRAETYTEDSFHFRIPYLEIDIYKYVGNFQIKLPEIYLY